jgi:DNA-binding response OmpR family regulator
MNIAIVNDSDMLKEIISRVVSKEGHTIHNYTSDINLKYHMDISNYQLALINFSLDHSRPIEILDQLKEIKEHIYTLGIARKDKWKKKVNFLESGGDDVINFPFANQELVARINSLVRRPYLSKSPKYSVGKLELDPNQKVVKLDEKIVKLRKKEYSVLEYLMQNKNRPISRNELLNNVWDYRVMSNSNTVDVHISNIRKRIRIPNLISTVNGFGYRLNDKPGELSYEKDSTIPETPEEL